MSELREQIVEFITNYKDVVERNALAEIPTESADYILSLLREHIKGIENPYGEAVKRAGEAGDTLLVSIYEGKDDYKAFEVSRQAILKELE